MSLIFFKSTGTVYTLPTGKCSTFVFKWFKIVGTLTNLLMSSLSTSTFKDVSTPVAWSNSFLVG